MKILSKRIIALFVTLSIMSVFSVNIYAAKSTPIELDVEVLGLDAYSEIEQQFTMLDLSPFANRGFADEVAGDGTGGWSDQGDNDMRMFPHRGTTKFNNVPFQIIDPLSNNGKSVVAVRGQNDMELPTRVEIPANTTAAGAYFLHSAPWGYGTCGKYEFIYEDGTVAYINLEAGVHINDFWNSNHTEHYRIVYTGANAQTKTASVGLFVLNNPYPEKVIKSIGVETDGTGAYIMLLGVTLTSEGPYLPDIENAKLNPSRRSWIEYEAPDESLIKGSSLDFSKYLDAPAGKHGNVTSKDEDFVFSDGTKISFWGTNIVGSACFPEKSMADNLACMIARCGLNLVRMSELDKHIFKDDYTSFDENKIDKLCYFISALKENGIYTYLSPISDERFKVKGFYDDNLIKIQKNYLKQLLTYKNPYTNLEIGKDSAIAMLELMDSNSMFALKSSNGIFGIGDYEQKSVINKKYNEFLRNKYGNDSTLRKAYQSEYDLHSNELLSDNSIKLSVGWQTEIYSEAKQKDIREFMSEIQFEYYQKMKECISQCNSSILTTANSNPANELYTSDSYSNSKTDFIAKNALASVPKSHSELIENGSIIGDLDSMLKDRNVGFFDGLLGARVLGKPYLISSYGVAQPNPYQSESILMMAAIGGQQNWTPIQYSLIKEDLPEEPYIKDYYSMYYDLARLAITSACSQLFRTMDNIERKTPNLTVSDIYNKNISNPLTIEEKLKYYSGIKLTETGTYRKSNAFNGNVVSNDGIYLDVDKGFFAARSDKCNAVSISKSTTVLLSEFEFISEGDYATVVLNSIDDKTINTSDKLLLTAVGRCLNSDLSLTMKSEIKNIGKAPVYVEPVKG